jgi:hypothetical protein
MALVASLLVLAPVRGRAREGGVSACVSAPAHEKCPQRDEEVSAILERFVLRAAKELAAYEEDSPEEALAVLRAAEVVAYTT